MPFAPHVCHPATPYKVRVVFLNLYMQPGQEWLTRSQPWHFDRQAVLKDEPRRAVISLGSSLLWETEQKDRQEEEVCFHDVILMTSKQHTQSNTPTSNVQLCKIQVQKKKKNKISSFASFQKKMEERNRKAICFFCHEKE